MASVVPERRDPDRGSAPATRGRARRGGPAQRPASAGTSAVPGHRAGRRHHPRRAAGGRLPDRGRDAAPDEREPREPSACRREVSVAPQKKGRARPPVTSEGRDIRPYGRSGRTPHPGDKPPTRTRRSAHGHRVHSRHVHPLGSREHQSHEPPHHHRDDPHIRPGPRAALPGCSRPPAAARGRVVSAAAPEPGGPSWTSAVRDRVAGLVPPGPALPDRQPAYVASWIYVFGVATLAALLVVVASGLALAVGGAAWWHTSS